MEDLEEELKKELTQFVYQHAWSSDCQTSAKYTGFHMINVFLEQLQNTAHNSEYKSALGIYQKYFNSSTTLEFGDWLRDRLNQQK